MYIFKKADFSATGSAIVGGFLDVWVDNVDDVTRGGSN
jgi:3D (Asp-Asp-Asp) domain-containing protein